MLCRVSSPYRYSANRSSNGSSNTPTRVSSPYRYSANWTRLNGSASPFTVFQALIGILRTERRPRFSPSPNLFQALIGILRTCSKSGWGEAHVRVSSPYRYSANRQNSCEITLMRQVSSPYRYSANLVFKLTATRLNAGFKPL